MRIIRALSFLAVAIFSIVLVFGGLEILAYGNVSHCNGQSRVFTALASTDQPLNEIIIIGDLDRCILPLATPAQGGTLSWRAPTGAVDISAGQVVLGGWELPDDFGWYEDGYGFAAGIPGRMMAAIVGVVGVLALFGMVGVGIREWADV